MLLIILEKYFIWHLAYLGEHGKSSQHLVNLTNS